MSKPTEGPWIFYGGGKRRWAVGRAGGGHCICEMTRRDGGEDKANARLIAASPKLLAACERAEKFIDAILSFYGQGLGVIHWHQNGDSEPLDNFIDDNSDGKELESLRAAIAKAKGAQQ